MRKLFDPSHYYTSWYHRAKAVITNNQFGREKDAECLKHENSCGTIR